MLIKEPKPEVCDATGVEVNTVAGYKIFISSFKAFNLRKVAGNAKYYIRTLNQT
jgi:hypothetical protein